MTGRVFAGVPASPGIVIGTARVLRWEVPRVPHGGTVPEDRVEEEVQALHGAVEWAQERIREVQQRTADTLGGVEARIFEPQILMLEDADLVDAAAQLIRENHLTAARAFEWRALEWESQWAHTAHPMVLDKLNDLADVQARVLRRLLGLPEPDLQALPEGERCVLVMRELTPSLAAQLDPARVAGIAMDTGTRASHSAILARSLEIPAVVSLRSLSDTAVEGQEIVLDGRNGRAILDPTEEEKDEYRNLDFQIREWEQELLLLAHLDAVTRDGTRIALRANIDLPAEARSARAHGAEGIGLFRTEFFVVGQHFAPGEDDQVRAYREVLSVFDSAPVVVRTFDLGGDKFPSFLHMPREDNPFLGWRAIRVCLDEPEFFLVQLRALLRAAGDGDLRIMLPLVNDVSELRRSRVLLERAVEELRGEGREVRDDIPVGVMIETPAAAMLAPELGREADFFSVGTNDLVQYTLAVDRGNSRLAGLYDPFHPAVIRLLHGVAVAGEAAGIEVGVCGELAGNPVGAFMFIGMGYQTLSVGPSSLAEIKKVVRTVSRADAASAAEEALRAGSSREAVRALVRRLPEELDLNRFGGAPELA